MEYPGPSPGADGSLAAPTDILSVRTLDKKEISLEVKRNIFVLELKEKIAAVMTVPQESQRLLWSGQEMAEDQRLLDVLRPDFPPGTAVRPIILYLVVKFPGATFGMPAEEEKHELPPTMGEESVLRSSRLVLRGTVTIPLPERDMHRVVAGFLNRGGGAQGNLQDLGRFLNRGGGAQGNLQDLVSTMRYIPTGHEQQPPSDPARRRAAARAANATATAPRPTTTPHTPTATGMGGEGAGGGGGTVRRIEFGGGGGVMGGVGDPSAYLDATYGDLYDYDYSYGGLRPDDYLEVNPKP
ncbi:hypothetical protein T484DRAFT_1909047 [Baffinella frigidus]|nr:hypothetical protein T484DRAFT_1909047 [Cryptophyta sp. CCMP2293]